MSNKIVNDFISHHLVTLTSRLLGKISLYKVEKPPVFIAPPPPQGGGEEREEWFVCVDTWVCMCACGGQMSTSGLISQELSSSDRLNHWDLRLTD